MNSMKNLVYILISLMWILPGVQSICYSSSPIDFNWKIIGEPNFSGEVSERISFAVDYQGTPYVAFRDVWLGYRATVMKYDGTGWVVVGSRGFTNDNPDYLSLAINDQGEPYLGYKDSGVDGKATVMKFNGTHWDTVGEAGFSPVSVKYVSMAISPAGQPYMAYTADALFIPERATVMKFDGTGWINEGDSAFTGYDARDLNLVFSSSGQLFLGYYDGEHEYKASVMRFNGGAWEYVGQAAFTGHIQWPSLAITSSEQPFLAFQDGSASWKESVMKFDGVNWVYVGVPGFSMGIGSQSGIAIDNQSQTIVAYSDWENQGKISVMKYNGDNWEYVGSPGFSPEPAAFAKFVITTLNQPMIAYSRTDPWESITVMKYDSVYVGIREPSMARLLIYPSLAGRQIFIDVRGREYKEIEIFEITGKKLVEFHSYDEKIPLTVDMFPSGIYLIKVKMNSQVFTGKFLKE
jgi:hypothetical protein